MGTFLLVMLIGGSTTINIRYPKISLANEPYHIPHFGKPHKYFMYLLAVAMIKWNIGIEK